jgi:hypothetical protein
LSQSPPTCRIFSTVALDEVEQALTKKAFRPFDERYTKIEGRFQRVQRRETSTPKSIQQLPTREQLTIQRMIALIYECSVNRIAAKALVDRILTRLGEVLP